MTISAQTIHEMYDVSLHGIVTSPGKFEGEPWWVASMWYELSRWEDDRIYAEANGTVFTVCKIDSELLAAYPGIQAWQGLPPRPARPPADEPTYIVLWEDNQGFVTAVELTTEQLDKLRNKCKCSARPSLSL